MRKLDELCACLDEPSPTASEHGGSGRQDVKILKSMPGIGKIILAILLAEASGPPSRHDYQALRTLSGVAPVIADDAADADPARLGERLQTCRNIDPVAE